MLQIEAHNLLIQQTLTERVGDAAPKSLDRIVSDFDFTNYHFSTLENRSQVLVLIHLQCWLDLVTHGVQAYLKAKYAPFSQYVAIAPEADVEPGYNFSLVVDLAALLGAAEQEQVIQAISLLKRHAMAAAFDKAFARYDALAAQYADTNTYDEAVQAQLAREPTLVIRYRGEDECIFIKPSFDRVTVIFLTLFKDETDKVFGKVFIQEFVDARRRSVQTAPQVLFSKEVPLDIAAVGQREDEKKGYVTFVLFPRHLTPGERREGCISHIQFFRNYFHYHIKCAKAYMHLRMRFRVKEFLKVLNRAKPENVDAEGKTDKKTASGRRFERT